MVAPVGTPVASISAAGSVDGSHVRVKRPSPGVTASPVGTVGGVVSGAPGMPMKSADLADSFPAASIALTP